MSIERDRINRVPSQENAIGTTHNSLAFALPTIGELVSSREPILPPKSPLTGLPDLQRFPDTFGYPAIWGGSGKDEQQLGETPEPEPSRFDHMTDEQLRAWTDTWTEPVRFIALAIHLSSPKERHNDHEDLLDEMELERIVEVEDILHPPPAHEINLADDEEYRDKIKESIWRSGERLGITSSRTEFGKNDEEEEDRRGHRVQDVGVEDINKWHLELLTCAEDVRERVVRSFPEYRDLSDDEFQQAMESDREVLRIDREYNA